MPHQTLQQAEANRGNWEAYMARHLKALQALALQEEHEERSKRALQEEQEERSKRALQEVPASAGSASAGSASAGSASESETRRRTRASSSGPLAGALWLLRQPWRLAKMAMRCVLLLLMVLALLACAWLHETTRPYVELLLCPLLGAAPWIRALRVPVELVAWACGAVLQQEPPVGAQQDAAQLYVRVCGLATRALAACPAQ